MPTRPLVPIAGGLPAGAVPPPTRPPATVRLATRGPRVSVALAACNGERWIEEQLQSIFRQTRRVDELVVYDDASDDATAERAQALLRTAPPGVACTFHRNVLRLGIATNFTEAIRACTGDIVFLADQDDIWAPHKVARMLAEFERAPSVQAVFSDAELVDDARQPLQTSLFQLYRLTAEERALLRNDRACAALLRRNLVAGATMAFRRELADQALPVPDNWLHDEWLALSAAAAGSVTLIDEPLIEYRQHDTNAVGARPRSRWQRLQTLRQPQRAERDSWPERSRELVARLHRLPDVRPELLADSGDKLRHVQARAALPGRRLLRLPQVLGELVSGRYGRYSNGLRSAIRDLLQRLD